jgi:hypothetical protein
MYQQYRVCLECGKKRPPKQFWRNAYRCRSCIARETGRRRSEEAKKHRTWICQEYNLEIGISKPKYQQARINSQHQASVSVPKTERDQIAAIIILIALPLMFLAGFVTSLIVWRGLWPIVIAIVGCFLLLIMQARLDAPRQALIKELTDKILRSELKRIETEQLEYTAFSISPEWREIRAAVIRRDGRICKHCRSHPKTYLCALVLWAFRGFGMSSSMRIRNLYDVTVDHILLRSRYPELALDINNLQVLCRRCNSSKGAKV